MKQAFADKDGNRINHVQWDMLRTDDRYSILRQYENDRFKVMAQWDGRVDGDAPKTYWKPFRLNVYNVKEQPSGERLYAFDPIVSKQFENTDDVMKAYYEFLEAYTDCHWNENDSIYADEDEKRQWVEVDNVFLQSEEHTATIGHPVEQVSEGEEPTEELDNLAGSW